MSNEALANFEQLKKLERQAEGNTSAVQKAMADTRSVGQQILTDSGDPIEAEFDTSMAAASGILAGAILGPVGGLVIGITQGLLSKDAQQTALDRAASEGNVLSEEIDASRQSILRQYSDDMSDQNRAILDDQLNRLDSAEEMIFSGSDRLRQTGVQLYGAVGQDHTRWREQQEAQRIAENAAIRATDEKTFANFRSDLKAYDAGTENSANLIDRARSIYDNAGQNDAVSTLAALSSMPLVINEDAGAMTDSEFELWQGVGGFTDRWRGIIEKELGEGGVTSRTRRQLRAEALEIINRAESFQAMRDGRAQGRAQLMGYTDQMAASFDSRQFIPPWQPGEFVESTVIDDAADTAADTATDVVTGQATEDLRNRVWNFGRSLGENLGIGEEDGE